MTATQEVEPGAVPRLGGFPHVGALPYQVRLVAHLDQKSAGFEADLREYDSKCQQVAATGVSDGASQAALAELWFNGVGVLDLIARWRHVADIVPSFPRVHPEGFAALTKLAPEVTSAMTTLAKVWLTPRSANETRGVLYERIAALRPIEQNNQLRELMGKNNEGAITPSEYAELLRLNEFFDTLQAIIDNAITSTRHKPS